MNNLDWDISQPQKIDSTNTYLDGGEIFSTICPPHGYVIWAINDIEICRSDIVIYGFGDTEKDARENLQKNIDTFVDMING